MSGPKCGRAELNRQREEQVRRQREREERVRQARLHQRADEQREKALVRSMSQLEPVIQAIQSASADASTGVAAQYAAAELRAWAPRRSQIQQEYNRLHRQMTQAQQQFMAATSRWRTQPDQYLGDHFGQIDVGAFRRRAEEVRKEGQRVLKIAAQRREEERLQRELERQQAAAHTSLLQARAARERVAALPHGIFSPGALAAIDGQLSQASQQLQQSRWTSAAQTAEQARLRSEATTAEIEAVFASWQAQFEMANAAVEGVQQEHVALDQEFIQAWAPGQFDQLTTAVRSVVDSLTQADKPTRDMDTYRRIVQQCHAIQAAIVSARETADAQYAQELRRQSIVDAIIDVLDGLQFNVGAELSNVTDPLGDVVISAGHPSGQEVTMRVDLDRTIHMNLEDGVKGADCVADVYNLIAGLQASGIELEMTDWGYADPDRLKRGGTHFSTGQGTRQDTTHS